MPVINQVYPEKKKRPSQNGWPFAIYNQIHRLPYCYVTWDNLYFKKAKVL